MMIVNDTKRLGNTGKITRWTRARPARASAPTREAPRPPVGRRGSVLVLVVGVLAVLAVMAISYVSVVRIDRRSTDAYQEQENLQQEVVVATSYLQALLTADQFGNRMTNASTPRLDPANLALLNWPKAFEDGEYSDYPWTDVNPNIPGATLSGAPYTWDTSFLPGQAPPINAVLDLSLGQRAFADDAWLAPIEPIDTGDVSGEGVEWDTWPQITNLLSAYRYRRSDPTQPLLRQWTRDTGRFVDLGQFLLQKPLNAPTSGPRHGFPGADLTLNAQGQPWSEPATVSGLQNGPVLGVNQRIFDLQMNQLQEYYETGAIPLIGDNPGEASAFVMPADERFWADTDGDGRPDARWQQLPIFGNAFEKIWVIAAHIVDNSALANVNAHINFMDYTNSSLVDRIGEGRTPADVDLYRLIASQAAISGSSTTHPDILLAPLFDANRLNESFIENLLDGLRVGSMLSQLDQIDSQGATQNLLGLRNSLDFATVGEAWPGTGTGAGLFGDPTQQLPTNPLLLKRVERGAIWRYFGSDPLAPTASTGAPYPIRDEIDLRTYTGYNLLRTVSRIEQRFDGPVPTSPGQQGFLPGVEPRYDDLGMGPGLGPMRSKEWDSLSQSPRTFNNKFVLLPTTNQYTSQEKLTRRRTDIRHLLTTVSGSGSIGPVPVLNPLFNQRFITRKVNLGRFVNADLGAAPDIERIREPVQRAFDAFVWALAPLATNQPLMSPLNQIAPLTYAQLADDADLHYGGGLAGPATKVAQDQFGLTPNAPGGADQIGAAYAVLRAAALAVNTVDAIDNQSGGVAPTATVETPTMVRLFNQLDLNSFLALNPVLRDQMNQGGVIPLGVRFPQGDIWSDSATPPAGVIISGQNAAALPPQVVGEPNNGVTLIGLDRQPFLVQAVSVAVYADSGATLGNGATDSNILPDDTKEQLGSFLAVELGNPWPDPIDLNGYIVRIDNGTDEIEIAFTPQLDINGGATIPAGQTVVFYRFREPQDPTGTAVDDWQIVRDTIYDTFKDNSGGEPDNIREITDPLAGSAIVADVSDMFRPFVGESLPVLLVQTIPGGAGGNTEVLVDRLSPDGSLFPATLTDDFNLKDFAGGSGGGSTGTGTLDVYTGRVAVQSSLRRPSRNAGNGFPGYVIERPAANRTVVQSDSDDTEVAQAWIVGGPNAQPSLPIDDIAAGLTDLGEAALLGAAEVDNPDKIDLPNFELFVPDGPLLATSELGQVCVFANMYIHDDQGIPDIGRAAIIPGAGSIGPGTWVTVSEQLGWDAHYFYNNDPNTPPVGLNLNPYLGVLDPSRFIIDNGSASNGMGTVPSSALPDALAVPLADRVFDAFEAIPAATGGLVQGRVNVNTAPRRILDLLPFVDPRDPFNPGTPLTINGWTTTQVVNGTRADWLERYRRRDADTPGGADNPGGVPIEQAPFNYTQLAGLRQVNQTVSPWSLGFVSEGEIASLGKWTIPNDGSIDATSPAFLELGANSADNSSVPLDIRPITNGFEAFDDPEERLALFRAISNIVSTRSDIFTAWFILRAYDPKDVEAITIPTGLTNDNDIASLMNPGNPGNSNNPNGLPGVSTDNPGLTPTFEKRILVIFDRSNVTRPTDRPKILLQVELPIQ